MPQRLEELARRRAALDGHLWVEGLWLEALWHQYFRASGGDGERRPLTGERALQAHPQEPAVPQPKIERVPHTVNFSGTFLSSFYLLRKLEGYKRLLTVERVELSADTREGYPNVNGNISIDLYLVKNAGVPLPEAPEAAETDGAVAAEAAGQPSQEAQG